MLRTELNSAWVEALSYYYFLTTGLITSVALGVWGYDSDYNLQINTWTAGCEQPTIEQLLSYDLAVVQAFYYNTFTLPQLIRDGFTLGKMPTSALSNIPGISLAGMEGFQVFDTTLQVVRTWTGVAWV